MLHGPRLHFSGTFISDIATVNNKIVNYDTESFLPHHSLSKYEGGNGGYNPLGTNYFMLKDVFVKKVCYINSRCTSERSKDAVIGVALQGRLSMILFCRFIVSLDYCKTSKRPFLFSVCPLIHSFIIFHSILHWSFTSLFI